MIVIAVRVTLLQLMELIVKMSMSARQTTEAARQFVQTFRGVSNARVNLVFSWQVMASRARMQTNAAADNRVANKYV